MSAYIITDFSKYKILDHLNECNVLSIEKTDKGYLFFEEYEHHYGVALSKEQVGLLIKELQDLIEDNKHN